LSVKYVISISLCVVCVVMICWYIFSSAPMEFHSFEAKDIDLNVVHFNTFQGKVVLIVNVASKCGYTEVNYKQLPTLYSKYRDQGFEIIAFPCNQFGFQESGTNQQIKELASTYGVDFLLMDKVEVNGQNAHPLWKFLKQQTQVKDVAWNFSKFLITRKGRVFAQYEPSTEPQQLEPDILTLLQDNSI